MKIAVATDRGMVASHFGRCPHYTLANIEDGVISDETLIANPGHQPGLLPKYLAERGVGAIIAGGMGVRAQRLFEDAEIEYIVGATGPVDEVLQAYLDGSLEPGEDLCSH